MAEEERGSSIGQREKSGKSVRSGRSTQGKNNEDDGQESKASSEKSYGK